MIFPILKESKQRTKSEDQLEAFVESKFLFLYTRALAILKPGTKFYHKNFKNITVI